MTPTITTPDQTTRAREIIELWTELDTEAQNESLARLVAAAVHPGPGSALERFAGTGTLDAESALQEINRVRVPLEREPWLDLLGRFIIFGGGNQP